ncbi:glycosyltransferase [Terrihabitans rhizophilus]|uniref:Glycosyltransferase n=1 Tax=Terrihabitans rhizophilus TaxID=3092662 RepID=A0ABU4RRG1_9HYPH|nr:glycosyltransferase [Terrihabitans sp. PJ23]MDX6807440.1 glycosyltransferase [Terrihabitans sp. PJ23]
MSSSVALVICGLLLVGQLVSVALADWRLHRRRPSILDPERAGPVSIVIPTHGIETFARETLESAFNLDYPRYELIFCVARGDDPITGLILRAIEDHPEIPARLLVGDDVISDNPKLNNCVKGWDAARYDWIILTDSNVLMPRDYIQRLMAGWRADTGLLCSPPRGSRPEGLWAEVECAFLNTLQARWQYAAEAGGMGFAQGKNMLWRRQLLDDNGGIRALAADIAEDAAATKIVRDAGFHVHLADTAFEQPLGRRSAGQVWMRQLRWARLRRVTFAPVYAPEILTGAALAAVFAAIAAAPAGPAAAALAAVLMTALFHAAELVLASRAGWHLSWRTPIALLIRDVLWPAIWIGGWAGATVVWRDQSINVKKGAALDTSLTPSTGVF